MLPDGDNLFVGQTRQRGPLALDAKSLASIDQDLVVDL
jgi:hypothetical protein